MADLKNNEKTSFADKVRLWCGGIVRATNEYIDKYSNFVDTLFADVFGRIGLFVGTKPGTSILISLFILLLCCTGFMNFYSENRSDKLWVPQDTQGQDDKSLYESFFQGSRVQYALLESKNPDSILTKSILQDAMTIYEQVHALSVVVDGEEESLSTLCVKDYRNGDPCLVNSVLENWNYNSSILGAEINDTTVLTTINAANDEEDLKNVLGDIQTNSGDIIVSAEAAMIFFFIEDNKKVVNGDYVDQQAEDWEEAFLNFLEDPGQYGFSFPDINIYRYATRSIGDEFGAAIQGDISLLMIAYLILFVYVAFNLGMTGQKCVRMRVSLSIIVLITVGISIAASTGVCSGFGLMYTPLHSALPFVLLGIGVDDSFVIADSFDAIHHSTSVPKRTSRALSHAGVSITITSLTDFAAFAVSSTTSLPALSSFCVYAAFGVLFLYFFQVLFFTAFLALDAHRQNASRPDCLCCITVILDENSANSPVVSPQTKQVEMVSKETVVVPAGAGNERSPSNEESSSIDDVEVEIGMVQHFLQNTYGPFLMKPAVKVLVILMFIGLLIFSITGASQLSVESADRSFIPDGSYVLDTLDASDKYFGENGLNIEIVTHNFDHFEQQDVLADIQKNLAVYDGRSPYLEDPYGPTYDSWYNSYIEWLNVTSSTIAVDSFGRPTIRSEFYDTLHDFLQGSQGRKYNSSVIRNAEGTNIEASKVTIQQKALAKYTQGRLQIDAKKSVEAMDDFRHICNGFEGDAFPWTRSYISTESLKSIQDELFTSITLSLLVVFVIVLLFIGSPTTSILITICVVDTVIGLLGVMYYWGLVIDGVGVINLVLAIGLAVDYSAHIGHAFMLYPGTRDERAVHAVGNIGAAVLNGALSTFLAVMLLSVSESYVFRVLFKQFFATVILGAAHGLILLPVLLSLIGPDAFTRSEQSHVYVKPPVADNHIDETQLGKDALEIVSQAVVETEERQGTEENI